MPIRSLIGSLTLTIVAITVPPPAQAQSVVWTCAAGGNNHAYEPVYVPTGVSWNQANSAARQRGGYLATTTTDTEASFLFSVVSANSTLWRLNANGNGYGPWLGAEQPPGSVEPAGGWRWITGESWGYTRWQTSEPSNYGGNEDAVCYYALGRLIQNRWNDLGKGNMFPRSYVIEWGSFLTDPPKDAAICPGGSCTFSVSTAGSGPFSFRWRKSGVPLADGPTGTGSAIINSSTAVLTVAGVSSSDEGLYDCAVTNACGPATSGAARLSLCPPDFNCDAFVNGDDYDAFVNAFIAGNSAADFNRDGFVNGDDFDAFVASFIVGCE